MNLEYEFSKKNKRNVLPGSCPIFRKIKTPPVKNKVKILVYTCNYIINQCVLYK